MITKMTKYSFIVLSSDLDKFLVTLQGLGIMDITRSQREIDSASKEMLDLSLRYKAAAGRLSKIPKEFEGVEPVKMEISDNELLSTIESAYLSKEELSARCSQLRKELQDALVWGEFSKDDIDRLKAIGFVPHFYCVSQKNYSAQWEEEHPLQVLSEVGGKCYFIILSAQGEEFDFPLAEAKFPDLPASAIEKKISSIEDGIKINDGHIAGFVDYTQKLNSLRAELLARLDLYFASAASVKKGERTISVLEGFAPTSDTARITEFLDNTDAFYLSEEAKIEDNPPVKLKNNWFSRLFEPIGALYVLPKYDELDLTPYFAPFYMLFFGLCLGDMGYGLLLVIAGILAAWKVPKMRAYGKLVIWLGLGSIIMPLLSGTFFGMKLSEIFPSMPDNIKSLFFSDMKMFWFAIIFGIFQIIFAKMLHAIDCFTRRKWDAGLTNVGWSLVVLWCALAYAGSEMKTELINPMAGYIMVGTGALLIIFCSKPSKNFFLRPLKGIISLYDITGVFGDILSYIRLFGLGTTGGILALVINSISMQLSGIPYIGWGLTVIMLIIGHLMVMGLSCLGAFVHPVRLTFVEFYKNAEFQGGGRAYNPLKINKQ